MKSAQELILAAPLQMSEDIYDVHQMVWARLASMNGIGQNSQGFRPNFIYRVESGMIKVRITDAPVNAARPVSMMREHMAKATVSLALWRDLAVPRSANEVRARIIDLLFESGLHVQSMRYTLRVAKGHKKRGNQAIALPVADVKANVLVDNATLAYQAWRDGIGRGKRFGFGLLDLTPVQ